MNGERSIYNAVFWSNGHPSNSVNGEDCAEIRTNTTYGFGTNEVQCSNRLVGLCEKRYQP